MTEPLRIGVIGVGSLGTNLATQCVAAEGASVVALADVSEAALDRAGEAVGVAAAHRYTDWAAMCDAEGLDAVVIATPHALHYEQVTAALDRGLHVLCEKPLTVDLEHARELRDRAAGADLTLMVGYQRHLAPPFIVARDRIRGQRTPRFITAEITQPWIDGNAGTWRTDPDLSGGGQLYDTGSHLLDAVLWMTGLTPTAVSAEMVFDDDADRVDTQAVLNVVFEEGTVASIAVSGDTPRVREHIHVWGPDGGTEIRGVDWNERTVTAIEPDGSETVLDTDAIEERTKGAAFVEAVRGGSEPPATAADAFRATAVTEAAYESAHGGERVSIEW
jgi:predicted dehydrogenase